VATTPVELVDIPAVIGVLVDALEDASKAAPSKAPAPTAQSVREDIQELLRDWFRPRVASITALTPRANPLTEEIVPPPTLVSDPLPPTSSGPSPPGPSPPGPSST